MIKLLQFTDMHLRDDPEAPVRGVNPQRSFEAVLYHARREHWPADAVLLTGDIANDEFDNSYERAAEAAAGWSAPVISIPGNHDNPEKLRSAFDRIPNASDDILDFARWRIVGLSSHVSGEVHGQVDEEALHLLEEAVATREGRNVIVAIHHHPVAVGSRWLDALGLDDAEEFRKRLSRLGVSACIFGHVHQAWDSMEDGVRYLGTPSTGRQFAARSDDFAESDAPPAYRWFELHDDGSIETAVAWL